MAELEWFYRLAPPAVGALFGWIGGLYGAGRKSAERDQKIKDDLRAEMTSMSKATEEKVEESKTEFAETLHGLRQKINMVELEAERRYLLKDDFKEFRDEYRENTNRIFDKLDQLARQ